MTLKAKIIYDLQNFADPCPGSLSIRKALSSFSACELSLPEMADIPKGKIAPFCFFLVLDLDPVIFFTASLAL